MYRCTHTQKHHTCILQQSPCRNVRRTRFFTPPYFACDSLSRRWLGPLKTLRRTSERSFELPVFISTHMNSPQSSRLYRHLNDATLQVASGFPRLKPAEENQKNMPPNQTHYCFYSGLNFAKQRCCTIKNVAESQTS